MLFELITNNIDKISAIFLLIFISLLIRLTLQYLGQVWITTTSHTSTLFFLPLITYVITKVITGNIALSLGMVGALSIVRFRNPVRSPLELSVYFGAITMGIAASVKLLWLFFFVFAITSAIVTLLIVNLVCQKYFQKPFFLSSFSEGNSLSTLDVLVTGEIEMLEQSNLLSLKRFFEENKFQYVLVSNNFDEISNIVKILKKDKRVLSYQLNR